MKKFDVCGLGNALVDLLFECSDSEFAALAMPKGGMRLIDPDTQKQVLAKLGSPVTMSSGGSVSNSIAIIGQLGGRGSLICSTARDQHGDFFRADLAKLGIEVSGSPAELSSVQGTGTSLVVVTPDAERSMSTSLGISSELNPAHISKEFLTDSRWLFIEGYVVANSDAARQAILDAATISRQAGGKVAITLSDAFVVNGFREFLDKLLPQVDLIFCNDVEAAALSGEADAERAFEKLKSTYKGLVVTAGAQGVYFSIAGSSGHASAYACEPIDLTGAGDAFAGAFLQGLCSELSAYEAAKKGCFYASKVIQQWGARIRSDMAVLHTEFAAGQ